MGVFAWAKPRYDRLRVRPLIVPLLAFVALFLFLMASFLSNVLGITATPCWVRSIIAIFITPCLGTSTGLRYVYLILMHRFAESLAAFGGRLARASKLEADDALSWREVAAAHVFALKLVFAGKSRSTTTPSSQHDQVEVLRVLKFMLSPMGQLYVALLAVLPFSIINVAYVATVEPTNVAGCVGCYIPARSQQIYIIVQIAVYLALTGFLGLRTRGLADHFGFFREGRFTTLYIGVGGALYASYSFGSWPTPEWFDPAITTSIVVFVMVLEATMVPVVIAVRMGPSKRVADVRPRPDGDKLLAPGSSAHDDSPATIVRNSSHHGITLSGVLEDAKLRAAFAKRVEGEFAPELLTFLDVVGEWEASFDNEAAETRLAAAKRITNAFFGPGALQQVTLSDATVARVQEELGAPSSQITKALFAPAKREAALALERGPFARFVETSEFRELAAQRSVVATVAACS